MMLLTPGHSKTFLCTMIYFHELFFLYSKNVIKIIIYKILIIYSSVLLCFLFKLAQIRTVNFT